MSERKPVDAWVRSVALVNVGWWLVFPGEAAVVFEADEDFPIRWRIEGIADLHTADTVDAAKLAAEDAVAARAVDILTKLGRLPCTSCNRLGSIDSEPVHDVDGSQCGGARACESCQGKGR
jgi:hypothetical protein